MCQSKGTDNPVKAERCIQNLKVQERANATLGDGIRRVRLIQNMPQHIHGQIGQQATDRGKVIAAFFLFGQHAAEDQHDQQNKSRFGPFDRPRLAQPGFKRADPVDLFAFVDEIAQRDHHQKGTAERGDRQMRVPDDAGVFVGL